MMDSKLVALALMTFVSLISDTECNGTTSCVSSCAGKPNGNYQSCKGCGVYVTCSNQFSYDNRPCPVGLLWDDNKKGCQWTSETCTENTNDIDECTSGPCQNGGACTDGINGYVCSCADGYTGTLCETNIDECTSGPCQNGGACIDGINGYVCSCADGYTGTLCETNIDECTSGPCQNGGACTDGINGYVCSCADGYTGTLCETKDDVCEEIPCSSWNFAYAECLSKSYVTIKISKKVSKSDCQLGKSYGLNKNGLWVDHGCRGIFRACQCSKTSFVNCDSWDFKYANCPLDSPSTVNSVRVVNKRSTSACELGTSFGTNNQGMWVNRGCRASFEVCRCSTIQIVNCDSWQFKYAECKVNAKNGILKMEVENKRSRSSCVSGDSFGIHENGIWVDKGCRAAFKICLN